MPDLLSGGSERAPVSLRLPRWAVPALLGGLLVLGLAAVAAPGLLASRREADRPPVVTALTSGGSVVGGSARLWLLLQGPPSARLSGLVPTLPGADVRLGVVPSAFSPRGDAVVRLDVTPSCPQALSGLRRGTLSLRVDDGRSRGPRTVVTPVDTTGLVDSTVRAQCAGEGDRAPARGPRVRSAPGGPPGALRTVVDLGAPGPEVVVVEGVTAGSGLVVEVVTSLPLRIAPGGRGRLVVDLRAATCAPDPGAPPFVLERAADGDVEPSVDPGLRGRLEALRRSVC